MATASEPRRNFDAAESDRRVRHPLQALRGHIRAYVLWEGLAVAVLYLAVCFWAGLAVDYGLFQLFAFDWVQELQQFAVDPATGAQGNVDVIIRGTMLCLFLGGLLGLVAWKILLRITREFSDPAIALVLERRFPGLLGDRLITAVELADPKAADKYGFSKSLVENTIQDAADRVEKVPVKEVLNWGRLRRLGLWCLALTAGMYVAAGVGSCAYAAVVDDSASPADYFWGFNDAASIWTERNVLLMNSYWPRRAHLEVIRFQDTPAHPGEMRVGRDEQRPDVQIRALKWVVAERASPDGWRALRWSDLGKYIDNELLDKVAIPRFWGTWLVDIDDLDPAIPGGILPSSWQGATVAAARKDLEQSALRAHLAKSGAERATQDLLDWQTWTLDKIELQERKGAIRRALREEHPQAYKALEEVFAKIGELAEGPRFSRTLRKLRIPQTIHVYYRGANTKNDQSKEMHGDNKFAVGLNDLKESVRFTARGEDYYTPYKKITLVPPPNIKVLTVDKEEPAYIYYRVQGEQQALKGKRQLFYGYAISNMGDASTISVPLGTNLVVYAQVDRPLKDGIRMRPPAQADDRTSTVPNVPVLLEPGGTLFHVSLDNVVKAYEFVYEFNDADNVKGRRRVRIQPIDYRPPEVLDVELEVVLRKPRVKADGGKAPHSTAGGADGFLITPDALLPFRGILRDDYGLTQAAWVHEAQQVEFELIGPATADKTDRLPMLALQGSAVLGRAAVVAGYFREPAGTPGLEMIAPAYWTLLTKLLRADLSLKRSEGEERVPLESFQHSLEVRSIDELSLNGLDQMIKDHAEEQKRKQKAQDEDKKYFPQKRAERRPPLREHSLKDEEGFDVKRYLPRLKALDPQKQAQLHFVIKLSVEATDNNVETGPGVSRNKAPFTFLMVSENELLGQIAIEEEVLRDRLDKAGARLRGAKTNMDEQIGKLALSSSDYSLVSLRVDDIRKSLLDAGTLAREVYNDYRRILKELEVNRVKRTKTDDVRDKIVLPLADIVDPNIGNFAATEAALEKLYAGLDEDLTGKRGDENRTAHLSNAAGAGQQLDRLIEKLNFILIAMDEGVLESKLLELIVNIEREQRQLAERTRFLHNREVENLLDILTQPKNK